MVIQSDDAVMQHLHLSDLNSSFHPNITPQFMTDNVAASVFLLSEVFADSALTLICPDGDAGLQCRCSPSLHLWFPRLHGVQ